jgi:hypothetical protein
MGRTKNPKQASFPMDLTSIGGVKLMPIRPRQRSGFHVYWKDSITFNVSKEPGYDVRDLRKGAQYKTRTK